MKQTSLSKSATLKFSFPKEIVIKKTRAIDHTSFWTAPQRIGLSKSTAHKTSNIADHANSTIFHAKKSI